MTIKKPVKKTAVTKPTTQAAAKPEGESDAAPAAPAGATIANRFKLDTPDPEAVKRAASASRGTKYAVLAGVIALIVSGVLTYVLYQHWEFLMPA